MANAQLDDNSRPALTAVSSADGSTVVRLYADPTSHRLLVQGASTAGSTTAQTAPNANIAQVTVGASDTTYVVHANVLCTAYTSGNLNINVVYTDILGNVITVPVQGHFTSGYGINVSGLGNFEGQSINVHAKGGTTVTVTTSGTFVMTYNAYAAITYLA